MIFAHTLDLVLSGRKVQTRRLKKPHQHLTDEGAVRRVISDESRRVVYEVGKSYAVQPGRTQKAVAHILLRAIREESVADISEADARAEGFNSREDFLAAWRSIHGAKADMQQRVWVLEFALVKPKTGSSTEGTEDTEMSQ